MNNPESNKYFSAYILCRSPEDTAATRSALVAKGGEVTLFNNTEEFLRQCAASAPDLAVVEDDLPAGRGRKVLADLLAVSWTTSTILVIDEPEEVVHEKTEGLGILGSVTDFGAVESLGRLLKSFSEIREIPLKP